MRAALPAGVLFIGLVAPAAFGAPKGYEKAYKSGVQLENAGSVVDALSAFEAIPSAARDFDTRLHIASCKRKLGRLLAAEEDYETIRTDPAADEPTRDTAASDLEALRARIPKILLSQAAGTSGIAVVVDGAPVTVPSTKLVDPGSHVIVARRGSTPVFERRLELAEGTSVSVVIDAPDAVKPDAAPATSRTPSGPTDAKRSSTLPVVGFVAGGVALVSIGMGSYFLVRAGSLRDERDQLAQSGDPAAFERADDARGAQTIARVGFGVGLAAAGAAAYFFVFHRSDEPPKKAGSLTVAPSIATSWGVSLQGVW